MPADATHSDAELVSLAATGSEHAFRALYRAYVRPVYWLAHGLMGNASDAEDVTQETFVVAWQKLPGLTLASDSLLPWLVTVCRFQAANRLRALRREREKVAGVADENIADTVDVARQVADAQLVEHILREVAGLDPIDQQIFRLCAAEGYAYQAAATSWVSHTAWFAIVSRASARVCGQPPGRARNE